MPDQHDASIALRLLAFDPFFDFRSETIGAAGVEPQSRGAGTITDARDPAPQWPQIKVAAEKSGDDYDQASVASWHAVAAIHRISQQGGKLAERQRFVRERPPSRLIG